MQSGNSTDSAELYDFVTGSWMTTSSMNTPRNHQVAILLPNGNLLIAGGIHNSGVFATAELYLNTVVARCLWSLADGGNDHVYELIQSPGQISWTDARDAAMARGGYLATITSSAENAIVAGIGNSSLRWIGGFQPPGSAEPAGGWSWVTGEPFNYTHWYYSEPNNGGLGAQNYIVLWNGDGGSWWVDADNVEPGGWATGYFVVEYDGVTPPPRILSQPVNKTVQSGNSAVFSVLASSSSPLSYQWRFNGQNIPNATSATLNLSSVAAVDSGGYSVQVWNAYGSVVSAPAHLAVLADGAAGRQLEQLNPEIVLPEAPGKDSVILVTHGWRSSMEAEWLTELVSALKVRVPGNWAVWSLDWSAWAALPLTANMARDNATYWGVALGKQLGPRNFAHVHFIAHSAGAELIDQATRELKASTPSPEVHCTFLDPFTGGDLQGRERYGEQAGWADNYFVNDALSDFGGGVLPKYAMGTTGGPLRHAYNVDVAAAEPLSYLVHQYWSGSGAVSERKVPVLPQPKHDSPCWFYLRTVNGTAETCVGSFGYGFSKAGGGWAGRGTRVRGEAPIPVGTCAELASSPSSLPEFQWEPVRFDLGAFASSPAGVSWGAGLLQMASTTPAPAPGPLAGKGGPSFAPDPFDEPAWYARAVEVTNPVNFVSFDAAFTSGNGTNGLLTVYWNTNQIGMVDERVAGADWQRYNLALPALLTEGLYTLSFRLDAFGGASSLDITNVATGYRGLTNPITLRMASSPTNAALALELTAPAGYNYLVQSSSTIEDWIPAALLVNTNGTVIFPDPAITNSSQRFYRAVLY